VGSIISPVNTIYQFLTLSKVRKK